MNINKNLFFEISFVVSTIVCIMSDILFFNIYGTIVPLYMVFGFVSLIIIFLNYPKLILPRKFIFIYIWFIVLILLSVVGVLLSGNIKNLAQIYIYIIMPFTFLYYGYILNTNILFLPFKFLIILCTFFSFVQFLNFSLGFDFFGLSSYIVNFIKDKQINLGVEEIGARATGFFVNPNILGFYAGLSLFLFLFKRYLENNTKSNIYIILSIVCILLSISRTSIVGAVLGLTVIYLMSFKKISGIQHLKIIVCIGIFLSATIYFFSKFSNDYYLDRLLEIKNVSSGDYTQSVNLDSRFDAWINITKELEKYPFGTIVPPQLILPYSPDSQFVYFYAQGGILLLLLFVVLLFSLTLLVYFKNKSMLGCISFLIFSSFTLVVFNTFTVSVFWLMLGLIYSKNSSKPLILRY